jgi:hypothetical protein
MKYDFIVNPGADVTRIKIRYEGINGLDVSPDGELRAQTKFGAVGEKLPMVYQQAGGHKVELSAGYILRGDDIFGFEVGEYDHSLKLIIDPELVYSTYLGGSRWDGGRDIAIDDSGCSYVTGFTHSDDFPTINAYDSTINGPYFQDVFVTKFTPGGDSLIYSTYLGGWDEEIGYSIIVDESGNAYVAGFTWSTDFPLVNPFDSSNTYFRTDAFFRYSLRQAIYWPTALILEGVHLSVRIVSQLGTKGVFL